MKLEELDAKQLKTWHCETEDHFPDWWCIRDALELGRIGNECFYECLRCEGFFRTGAA